MQVRSAMNTSNVYGMSSLWHDVDYVPEKRFDVPVVHKGLEEMPLPSEMHQRPEGDADPYKKQEIMYDVAAQQMERGLAGKAFLEGHREDITQKIGNTMATQEHRIEAKQIQKREEASKAPLYGKVSSTDTSQNARPVSDDSDLNAAQVMQGVGMVAGMMTTAASQSIQGVQLPSAVKDVVSAAGATVGAVETGAMGVAQTMLDDEAEQEIRVKARRYKKD